jgi:hypothetical protein
MDEQLFRNLTIMVQDQSYFDVGVAEYILNRLGKTAIEQHLIDYSHLKTFQIKTNLAGLISLTNKIDLPTIKSDNTNISMDMDTKYNTKEQWKELLQKFEPSLIKPTMYYLKKHTKIAPEYLVSFNLILALYNLQYWFKMFSLQPEIYNLTKAEEYLLLENLIDKSQHYSLYKHEVERQPAIANYIMTKMVAHLPNLKKNLKKDEETIISHLFSSDAFKLLLLSTEQSILAQLFSSTSLKSIINKTSLKENITSYPHMLSKILPIASAETWIQAYKQKDTFDLIKFFGPLMFNATGYTTTDVNQYVKNKLMAKKGLVRYKHTSTEILLLLNYFSDSFKKLTLTEENLVTWYFFVMSTNNEELYKKSRTIFDLPQHNSSTDFFYDGIFTQSITQERIWKHVEIEFQKEKLNIELLTKTEKLKTTKI